MPSVLNSESQEDSQLPPLLIAQIIQVLRTCTSFPSRASEADSTDSQPDPSETSFSPLSRRVSKNSERKSTQPSSSDKEDAGEDRTVLSFTSRTTPESSLTTRDKQRAAPLQVQSLKKLQNSGPRSRRMQDLFSEILFKIYQFAFLFLEIVWDHFVFIDFILYTSKFVWLNLISLWYLS